MSKWETIRLGDCAHVQTGPFGSQLHQKDYVSIGTPIITVEHLGENRILKQNLPLVSDTDKERLKKYTLEDGDIVFSRVGSVDRRALVRHEEIGWLFSGRCLRVRFDKKIADPSFMSYQFGLGSFKEYIRSIAVGATMPSLNTKILSDVFITLPPLDIQKKIANILDSIDDKIALNREMNKTLEAMAQAIFKSWFVDFEPFRDGEFVESELGMIPKGWEVKPLTECTKVIGGGTPKTSIPEYWNGDISWFSVVDAPSGSDVFVVETEKSITQEGLNNSSTKLLDAGTTIVTARGTVGKIALAGTAMTMNQSCYALAPIDDTPYFTYYLVSSSIAELKQKTHGSVFDTITKETLSSIQVIKPSIDVKKFESKVEPIMLRIKENLLEIKTLASLRDTLLPKLLSGEIEV